MPRPDARCVRIGALALAMLAAATTAATASAAPHRPAPRAKLQHALDAVVSNGAPGAIALIRNGDRTLRLASGYGTLPRRRPMRTSDRFRTGSVTKTFVATVVLQLAGEGTLALDDTVERWLPGLVPGGANITIRQLLNHTSGLYDYANDAFVRRVLNDRGRVWAPRELIAIGTTHAPRLGLMKTPHRCGASWGHGGETLGYETNADSSPDGTRQAVIAINADQSVLATRRAQLAISRLQELAYCG